MSRDRYKEFKELAASISTESPNVIDNSNVCLSPAPKVKTEKKGFFSKLGKKFQNDDSSKVSRNSKSETSLPSNEVLQKVKDEQGEAFACMVSCMMEDADQLTREAKALRERANTLYLQYNDAALTSETTEIQKEVTQVVDSLNQISNKLKKLMLDFEKVDPRDHPFSQKIKQSHMNYFKEKYFDHINQLMTLRGKFDSAVNSKRNQRNQTFLSVFGGQQNLEKTGDGEGEELQFAVVDLEEWYTHVLDEAQERKAQLDKLEKSLITVHSLFKDLAALVYEQSYKLNTIEDAVMSTDATITQARIELKEGIRQQKKLRKKQITTGAMVGVGAGLTALKLAVPTALPFV